VAVLVWRRAGLSAEPLVSAVKSLTWFNQEHGYMADRDNYVSLEERTAFIRAVDALPWGAGHTSDLARAAVPQR
jgi:hypothetical protein